MAIFEVVIGNNTRNGILCTLSHFELAGAGGNVIYEKIAADKDVPDMAGALS